MFFKPELLYLIRVINYRLIIFRENNAIKYIMDTIFKACIAKKLLEQYHNIRQYTMYTRLLSAYIR